MKEKTVGLLLFKQISFLDMPQKWPFWSEGPLSVKFNIFFTQKFTKKLQFSKKLFYFLWSLDCQVNWRYLLKNLEYLNLNLIWIWFLNHFRIRNDQHYFKYYSTNFQCQNRHRSGLLVCQSGKDSPSLLNFYSLIIKKHVIIIFLLKITSKSC